ncbi:MAG: aminoacetone oxidase family FAD-binding enzyme [Chlorobiaceae bacterium]|nr:aminoacetone oxidase family FAD-binding enzyme [Chlorobiaceae bacterium]
MGRFSTAEAVEREPGLTARRRLVIVGSGASGMLAAVSARLAARGLGIPDADLRIVLLERNPRPGAKIAISGGGHCNVTHEGAVDRLLEKGFLRKNELRFVKPSIYAFTNADLLGLLARYGVPTAAREDGRVFPVSGFARDVLDAMQRMLREASAELVTGCRVDGLEVSGDRFLLRAGEARFEADAVILGAGGSAWGSSGTTGDGVRLASSVGHAVATVLPALAPVFFAQSPDPGLVGVTLRGVGLVAESGKESDMRRGDILVSHRGISGPACLSLSRSVAAMMAAGNGAPTLFADFFPGHDEPSVAAFVLDHASRNGSQLAKSFLQRCPMAPARLGPGARESGLGVMTIPNAFVPEIMRRAGITEGQTLSVMTRQQRRELVSVLKRFELGKARKVPLDKAEVSAGGVSLSEIDPKTMESRLHRRLYCCGELLDYAGEVGGFNLQAAFSTGWAAGRSAALALFVRPSAGA